MIPTMDLEEPVHSLFEMIKLNKKQFVNNPEELCPDPEEVGICARKFKNEKLDRI